MILSLRAGAKVYLNGAVIRVDRKVNLELMNDVTFLLESHVLQVHEATTPLRQLYFVLQTMLMDPSSVANVTPLFETMMISTLACFADPDVISGLNAVKANFAAGHLFDALKGLRKLYRAEAVILSPDESVLESPTQAA